jgi:MYXO-CTERM domain-containing protein
MRRAFASGLFLSLAVTLAAPPAAAASLSFGVVSPNLKVRPMDAPKTSPSASLKAAKNEFEAFQIVFGASAGDVSAVSVKLSKPLAGPSSIPAENVVFYREAYYDVGTPSNAEGAAGLWPDPLVPDRDVYFGETRNAFPFDVPMGETRAVWVDVLVPADAAPGDYTGEIEIDAGGAKQGVVPIALHVGTFALPSTASLASTFGMGWSDPCLAHTGDNYCGDPNFADDTADALRALYVRSALEHRFTVSPIDFQPPIYAGDQPAFEQYLLPYVNGTGASRLQGAKVTCVILDGGMSELKAWIDYAKAKGFFDRLLYYPVDEPNQDQSAWNNFMSEASALHQADAAARILITSSIQDADAAGASDSVDVFVPVIDELEGRPGSNYDGNQRSKYDAWLSAKPNRSIWSYQSCDEHGCGACGETSPDPWYSGWPNRVIDSSAVQDRAFPWHAFRLDFTGELYFDSTYQLTSAWDQDGQCAFSGSGDGTIFYPGTPAKIGGTKDIPVESIRMKMIREGMEDYEYLKLVAATDPAKAKEIANGLFPHTYESAKTPEELEAARAQLFALLDHPGSTGTGGAGAGGGAGTGGGVSTGGEGGTGGATKGKSGCGCRVGGDEEEGAPWVGAALIVGAALARRRRPSPRA